MEEEDDGSNNSCTLNDAVATLACASDFLTVK